jgi:hypothetical protein
MSFEGATMTPIKFVRRGGGSIPPCKWMQKFNAFDVKTQPKTNVNPKIIYIVNDFCCLVLLVFFN